MIKTKTQIKSCASCGETKPLIYFAAKKDSPDGRKGTCKDCIYEREDKNLNKRIRRWKWGASTRKIEWKITNSYINSMPKVCYYTGTNLTMKRNQTNTLSLDRKDSSKGYVKSNVVFCCAKINIMKSDLKIDEFVDWCKKIARHNKKTL